MPSTKWIIFDIGGVVVNLNRGQGLRQLASQTETTKEYISELLQDGFLDPANYTPIEQFQIGKITEDAYLRWFQSKLNKQIGIDEIRSAALTTLAGENADTCALIKELTKTHNLACFSNTHALHWDYMLANYRIFDEFKVCMASHLAGVAKPHAAAFEYICRELSTTPAQCVFVDDLPQNVKGAESFGMTGVLFSDAARLRQMLGA